MLGALLVSIVVLQAAPPLRADTTITDFDAATLGSYNPRASWSAFGAGTTDQGIRSDGSSGNAAYHSVNWAQSSWGIGDIYGSAYDLSEYLAITVDARLVDLGSLTGTALLNFALDLPNGTEYSTPSVTLTNSYQTYVFNFSTLTQTAGSGSLDLTAGTPKFIVRKNGQSGLARFDFDEIVARTSDFVLMPVILNPPWDGDNVRAMWLYTSTSVPYVDTSANAQAILDFCAREGVNRINFAGYPIWHGTNTTYKNNLRTFVAAAHASDIRVEAVLDGNNWQDDPNLVQTHILQILSFQNATTTAADDFDAVHLDVEFWLDSEWKNASSEAARQVVARKYLDNVLVKARSVLNANQAASIEVATDLAAHFDSTEWLPSKMVYDSNNQYFIEHVLDHADDVVIMSYYDDVPTLWAVSRFELDAAAGMSRKIQLGADIAPIPPENPVNTFADETPTPYSAMTTVLQDFHTVLTPVQLAGLDGFSIFHYAPYSAQTPNPLSRADLNGDGQVTAADFTIFAAYLLGPNVAAASIAKDGDFDRSGAVDLLDFAQFQVCFTGSGSVPSGCER